MGDQLFPFPEESDLPVDVTVEQLLAQRYELYSCMQGKTEGLRMALLAVKGMLDIVAEPYLADLQALDEEIKAKTIEWGETVSTGDIEAQYTKGYDKVTWNNKALDGYAIAHPEIVTFRKMSVVAPRVKIKVLQPVK